MKIFFSFFIPVLISLSVISCSEDDAKLNEDINKEDIGKTILSFNTKDDLNLLISGRSTNVETRTSTNSVDQVSLSIGQSLYEQENYNEELISFVPNERFARLLNKNGEIIVGDIVYKITPNGTYYFNKSKKNEFDVLYEKDNNIEGKQIADKLYEVADGVYRYDTFYKEEPDINYVEKTSELNDIPQTRSGHSTGPNPNIEILDWFTADRTTWLGKIFQNLFGASKEFGKYYPHTDKRRVKGSFYFYDYVVYAEIGVQGWTDKKNLVGWSKTASDDLRVGWRNVVLVTKIPDYYKKSLNTMGNLARSVSPIQYMDVPGTMYKVNMKTMVIPDFDATGFDKILNKGASETFGWLKGLCPQNQTDWDKAEAALVISRTHIFTIFRDQDIQKIGVKSYTHTFAQRVKFSIGVNLSSFPQSLKDYAGILVDVVKNSSQMEYPTLANGDVYIAARFGEYWQGMRIKKKQAEVISTMNLR